MTIYIPHLTELPIENMRALNSDAQFSITESDGQVRAYSYDWPDLRVVINVLSGPKLTEHLQGFIGFVRHGCTALKKPIDQLLEARILSTKLVLGFVVEKSTDRRVWFGRVENLIGAISHNTGALTFWEGSILDENARQLFPPAR